VSRVRDADSLGELPLPIRVAGRSAALSPLRYPGGKAALAGFFDDIFSRLGLRKVRYVEPYAGGAGAGIILLQQGAVERLVINDIDPAVYCFWRSVVDSPHEFMERIAKVPLTVEEWRRQKKIYRGADESDVLALGFAFFYLNRTNRSGILNAGPIGGMNQSGNYKINARFNRQQLIDRIDAIGALSSKIIVSSIDGRAVFDKYVGKSSTFVYVDPPYVDMGGSLYLNAFTHRDHADLASSLDKAADGKWILTYDPSDFVRRLYQSHQIREYELSYSARRTGKARELLIASRPVAAILADD
jgi:DNA adenine methylase